MDWLRVAPVRGFGTAARTSGCAALIDDLDCAADAASMRSRDDELAGRKI
jgi:hypothetical protein